jgi:hypothetical protein
VSASVTTTQRATHESISHAVLFAPLDIVGAPETARSRVKARGDVARLVFALAALLGLAALLELAQRRVSVCVSRVRMRSAGRFAVATRAPPRIV